jgi:hypothetical protein
VVPLVASGGSADPQLAAPSLELLQELATGSPALAAFEKRATAAAAAAPKKVLTETQPPLPWDQAVPDAACGWPIALPQGSGADWKSALSSELEQAAKQDPAIMERGLTIVLKKNGRVGTRRLGMPDWGGLLADVQGRKMAGMDTTNI